MSSFLNMSPNRASMQFRMFYLITLCSFIFKCNGLNCRSQESRREEDYKNIFMNCLKRQDSKNSSNRYHGYENEWRETPSFRNSHNRDSRDDRNGYRDDGYGSSNDRMGYREDSYDDENGRHSGRNDRSGGRNDRGDRSRSRGKNDRNGGMEDMLPNHDRYGNKDHVNGREDFQQSSEFGDVSRYNNYKAQQRYKRSRNSDKNSGHRSQYNPNTSRQNSWSSGNDDKYRNERNSSEDNGSDRDAVNKACALHCFLENLEMTGSDGMPDKYLTTHALTKDVTTEDLRDFLQESVEECFQILENENTEDKCEFSQNLLVCLSEKGRANCDDWREDETQIKIF